MMMNALTGFFEAKRELCIGLEAVLTQLDRTYDFSVGTSFVASSYQIDFFGLKSEDYWDVYTAQVRTEGGYYQTFYFSFTADGYASVQF